MPKKWLPIIFLFVIGQFAGCAYYNTFYNAKKFYRQAENERKKRQRTQVVQLSPEEMLQQQKQGLGTSSLDSDRPSATEMQNYQRAIEKASSVLEFYPKSRWVDDALMMVGECFYYRREYSKSLRKFEEVIQLYPKSEFIPRSHLMIARNYLGLGEYDKAEKKFREIALDNKMPKKIRQDAEYELAGLYFVKGSYEQAANEYRRTAKESDDKLIRAMSYYRLGECLISMHAYQEAMTMFKLAVDESPNEDFKAQATFKLGESQSLLGNFNAAIRTFSNLLAKELETRRIPMIKLQLANNLRLKGDLEAAIKWYNNIIEEHKNTDAAAKSYFALGDIEENVNNNYSKAKENYELVRGAFASSSIAPEAKARADYIGQYLELKKSINELLGIGAVTDSLPAQSKGKKRNGDEKDDAPIDLSNDGMWVNYTGRNRPAPKSSLDDQTSDKMAMASTAAMADSLQNATATSKTALDSAALALKTEKEKRQKALTLVQKELSLAEILLFHFNKVDSAMAIYESVVQRQVDTTLTARALYSLAYIIRHIKKQPDLAIPIFQMLLEKYPETAHAEGARRALGLPLLRDQVDSAAVLYRQAELLFYHQSDTALALSVFNQIPEKYPDSPFAIKAKYFIGWYAEQKGLYDQALAQYKKIVEENPTTEVGKKLQMRLAAHEQAIKLAAEREKALADSVARAAQLAQGKSDGLQTSPSDSASRVVRVPPADAMGQAPSDSITTTTQPLPPHLSEEEMEQLEARQLSERRRAATAQPDSLRDTKRPPTDGDRRKSKPGATEPQKMEIPE